MITFILYALAYFVIGFIFAKFKKYYDEIYNPEKAVTIEYPTLGILWIFYVAWWVITNVISFVHKFYSAKL